MSDKKRIFRGDRLKAARERIPLSQEELAIALGIGQAQINRYEHNKNEPNTETLVRIASYLKVSSDWLLGLTNEPTGIYAGQDLSEIAKRFASAAEAGDFKKIISMALDKVDNA